jgi:prepilin-type N-terminal cleavage/methylation domain-containing protein
MFTLTPTPIRYNDKGFTLVELMTAMIMGCILVAMSVGLIGFTTRSYHAQERLAGTQQDIRAGLDIMAREIRMAACNPGGTSGANLLQVTASTIRFTSDVNRDNIIQPTEDITYTYEPASGTLFRMTNNDQNAKMPIIEGVTAVTFTYWDTRFTPAVQTAALLSIGRIGIALTCQLRDQKGGTFERTLNTNISIRNLNL